MKNQAKLAGILVIAAFIGFSLMSCPSDQIVATPVADPPGGTYTGTQTVTLSCATAGASIYYTTDGSTPTASSALYANAISISQTTTLKAIAIKTGMDNSYVLTAAYTINLPLPTVATPTASPVAGTYTGAQTVTLSSATDGASIYYTTDDSPPTAGGTLYSSPITISETTTLKAVAVKSGMNDSAVLTAVYTINDPQLETVATPTASPAPNTYTSAQTVTLACAESGASIYYTIDESTPTATHGSLYSSPISISETTTLKAVAVKSGMNNSSAFTALYTINIPQLETVATPTASPAAGTYTSAQTVNLVCTTDGASIRYTTNGTDPTASSTLYSAPIPISATTTLKAIAVKSGMNDSNVLTAVYTISPSVVTNPSVTFSGVTANGSASPSQTTTQLTLTFSAAITGLTAADITLTGVTGVTKGTLSGTGSAYTLPISGFTSSGTLNVAVAKTGYDISGSPKTVPIFYNAPSIAVTFSSVTANGSASQTTTQLTLTFSAAITGLTAADITLSGVTGVTRGSLTGSGTTYTLGITVASVGGTLNVAVAKAGYTVSGSPKTVEIFYNSGTPTVTPVTSWKELNVSSTATANQHSSYQSKTDVLHIAPNTEYNWAPLTYSLSSYTGNDEITIDISMQVWLDVSTKVAWQVNDASYTLIAGNTSTALTTGQWHTVSGSKKVTLGTAGNTLYLSGQQIDNKELYITGFTVTIKTGEDPIEPPEPPGPVTPPNDPRILDPATTNTALTATAFTVSGSNHGGGNKWLIEPAQPSQSRAYGYETWDEKNPDGSFTGSASFIWRGRNQGGGLAFKAEWTNVKDFLARTGYNWNEGKSHADYGNIYCGFNFTRTERYNGNFSYIGIYGWSRNPGASVAAERLIEYYIVEDSYGNRFRDPTSYQLNIGNETLGINPNDLSTGKEEDSYELDGATYKVFRKTRTGPSIAGDTTFTQFFSVRQTPRQSGTISVSEHFRQWAERGMNLGTNIHECKFKIEAGGNENGNPTADPPVSPPGTGTFDARLIQFYRANNDGTIIEITE